MHFKKFFLFFLIATFPIISLYSMESSKRKKPEFIEIASSQKIIKYAPLLIIGKDKEIFEPSADITKIIKHSLSLSADVSTIEINASIDAVKLVASFL